MEGIGGNGGVEDGNNGGRMKEGLGKEKTSGNAESRGVGVCTPGKG